MAGCRNHGRAEESDLSANAEHEMDLHSFFDKSTAIEQKTFKILCHEHDDVEERHAPSSPTGKEERKKKYLILPLFCSSSACTDYDLTGQIVWPVSGEDTLEDWFLLIQKESYQSPHLPFFVILLAPHVLSTSIKLRRFHTRYIGSFW